MPRRACLSIIKFSVLPFKDWYLYHRECRDASGNGERDQIVDLCSSVRHLLLCNVCTACPRPRVDPRPHCEAVGLSACLCDKSTGSCVPGAAVDFWLDWLLGPGLEAGCFLAARSERNRLLGPGDGADCLLAVGEGEGLEEAFVAMTGAGLSMVGV